jgi:hypothetical protein
LRKTLALFILTRHGTRTRDAVRIHFAAFAHFNHKDPGFLFLSFSWRLCFSAVLSSGYGFPRAPDLGAHAVVYPLEYYQNTGATELDSDSNEMRSARSAFSSLPLHSKDRYFEIIMKSTLFKHTSLRRDAPGGVILDHLSKKIYPLSTQRRQSLLQGLAVPLWECWLPVLQSSDSWPDLIIGCSAQPKDPEQFVNLRIA